MFCCVNFFLGVSAIVNMELFLAASDFDGESFFGSNVLSTKFFVPALIHRLSVGKCCKSWILELQIFPQELCIVIGVGNTCSIRC